MLYVFMIVGALILLLGMTATLLNVKTYRQGLITTRVFLTIPGIGAILAGCSLFVVWPYDINTKIVGFPFPAAAWERDSDGGPWIDFVGDITTPMFFANGVCWAVSFQIPLFLWQRARKKSG